MNRPSAIIGLVLATSLWGVTNVTQKAVFAYVDVFTSLGFRYLLATLFLLPFAIRELKRPGAPPLSLTKADGLSILWFGLAVSLQQFGANYTTATNLGFFMNLTIIFVPILVWFLRHTLPAMSTWVAAAMCFVGTILLSGGSIGHLMIGDAITILSALFYAVWIISTENSRSYGSIPSTMTVLQFILPITLGFLVAFGTEHIEAQRLLAALPDLAMSGILGSGLGVLLAVRSQVYLDAPTSAICYSLEAVVGAGLAYVWLGEQLTLMAAAGGALIMVGVLVSQIVGRPAVQTETI